ncbi:MAG: hypothetical protein V4792_09740 [Pseudomonadota bacterium]
MAERTYLGGITNTVLHSESDGTLIVEERQDCESILDHCAAMRNERFSDAGTEFRELCTIPMTVLLEWCREAGVSPLSNEADFVIEKKLRDSMYAKLRSGPTVRDAHIIIKGAR